MIKSEVFCLIAWIAFSASAEILNTDLSLLNGAPSLESEALDPYWNLSWHGKAAIYGDRDSQFFIGEVYEQGEIVPRDLKRAISYYRQAALQNHIEASLKLAKLVPEEAEQWLLIAARQNDPQAQIELSRYYENNGDIEQAISWLERALRTLFPDAQDLTLVSPDLQRLKGNL